MEDDYFKAILGMKRETDSTPGGRWLVESVGRSLTRPQGRKLALALAGISRDVAVTTPSGLYLGTAMAYTPDWARLERFAERLVRGLYWREQAKVLPSEHWVRASIVYRATNELQEMIAAAFAGVEPRDFGPGVFRYLFMRTPEAEGTAWVLEFLQDLSFFALTANSALSPTAAGSGSDMKLCLG